MMDRDIPTFFRFYVLLAIKCIMVRPRSPYSQFADVILCFLVFYFSFILLWNILCMLNVCKVKSPCQKELLTPTEKTLHLHCLKHLVWSQAFISIFYVCHYNRCYIYRFFFYRYLL